MPKKICQFQPQRLTLHYVCLQDSKLSTSRLKFKFV